MAKITCPNCGETIEVDPSAVEDLTRQLRDELFEHDLEARLAEVGHRHEAELAAARAEEQREAQQKLAAAQSERAELQARLDAAAHEAEVAVERERGVANEMRAKLEAQLAATTQETDLAVERARAAAGEELSQLRAQLAAATEKAQLEAEKARATAQEEIAELRTQLQTAAHEAELVGERERAAAAEERARLQHQLDEAASHAAEREAQVREESRGREAALVADVTRLQAELAAQGETLRAQGEAELLKATAELERRRDELEAQLKVERARNEQEQARLREEMAERTSELARQGEQQLEAKNAQIDQYKDELARLRDYRIRLSTKLIGESLERHCESEFNRIRLQAYPRATFEKDNEAVGGTKGDFIFRDYDEEGNELLSIMFEMKNEEELSATPSRKRNEDHFKKLDADRTKKGCEYAVLVSTLEPESDFYNAGIADVSWHYPRMFVVRPQCFTTIIGLLKAAALTAHPLKLQLERVKREELDVTTFEDKVEAIMGSIQSDYERAAKNYDRAEADIDAIIKKLEDLKSQLRAASKWFGAAYKQSERLTVKRLTRGNATMKTAFAEARTARDEAAAEAIDSSDEPTTQEDALDPDALE